jgi:hypothetical protein
MGIGATDFTDEELAEDMDGLNVSFQRLKIPGSGTIQFEIPSDNPERPNYAEYITGVILFSNNSNAYWPEGSKNEEATPPLCSSNDGKMGFGEPGGVCATCHLNVYGTGTNGKGKACKNMRQLYILRSGDYMPIQLTLPPTSIKSFSDFASANFIARRRATYGSVVQIGLKKMNNGKDDYSVATFRRLYDFDAEMLEQIRPYANGFREQIISMLQQPAVELEPAMEYDIPTNELEPLVGALPTSGSFASNIPAINGNATLPQ